MKKIVYDIGDWVVVKYPSKSVGVIIDLDIDGVEPPLYRVLIQNKPEPLWVHVSDILESI
jgi:hypothetical protein